ncbi:class I SAM-dependent methyltransferase [Planctomycetota bacterium]
MSKTTVIKSLVKDIKVGAVLPTSSFSVKKLCRRIKPDHARVVIEFGPGTGPFTEYLLDRMPPNSKLILIETNPHFIDMLRRIDDERVHVFHDSAENVKSILADCGEHEADYVISGIPFSLIKEPARSRLLRDTRNLLSDHGRFIIYQHSGKMKKLLTRHFENVETELAVFNIPPLFIMEAYC